MQTRIKVGGVNHLDPERIPPGADSVPHALGRVRIDRENRVTSASDDPASPGVDRRQRLETNWNHHPMVLERPVLETQPIHDQAMSEDLAGLEMFGILPEQTERDVVDETTHELVLLLTGPTHVEVLPRTNHATTHLFFLPEKMYVLAT